MLQIYDSLKNLINPEMISKASVLLGEKDSKVSTAVSSIIPTLLGGLLKRGDSSQTKKILEEAGRTNVSSDLGNVFSGDLSYEQENVGDRFTDSLFGGKLNDIISAIGNTSGLSFVNSSKLISLVSPMVAGFLGNKLVNDNYSYAGLLNDIDQEKNSFINMIPGEISRTLGFSESRTNDTYYNKPTSSSNNSYDYTSRVAQDTDDNKGSGWWKWLLLGLLLLLALFFLWRSCNRTPSETVNTVEDRTSEVIDTVQTRTNNAINDVRDEMDYDLPDGTRINAYRGGMEDRMIAYLKSDDYRNADAEDLKNKWFEFDNINFEHGSANQLMNNSNRHLNNIVAILKAYPDAKIRIAGYADKTGGRATNQEISEQRANYIKSVLVKGGINANRIITEGFGEEYATVSENASDAERAQDRDIAFRFVK